MTLLQVSGVLASTASRNTNTQPKSKKHAAEQQSDTAAASDTTGAMAESASEALNGCMERVCSPIIARSVGPANAVALLQDLASLMQLGRSVTILALNDVQLLFKASVGALTAVGTSKTAVQGTRQHELQDKSGVGSVKQHQVYKHSKKLKNQHSLVLHKLVFMLAWANEQSDASYDDLHEKVLQEIQEHTCDLKSKSTHESLLNLQPESFVGSMLQQDKLSVQQKPIIETL